MCPTSQYWSFPSNSDAIDLFWLDSCDQRCLRTRTRDNQRFRPSTITMWLGAESLGTRKQSIKYLLGDQYWLCERMRTVGHHIEIDQDDHIRSVYCKCTCAPTYGSFERYLPSIGQVHWSSSMSETIQRNLRFVMPSLLQQYYPTDRQINYMWKNPLRLKSSTSNTLRRKAYCLQGLHSVNVK